MTNALPAFTGFGEKALPFFRALDFHQDRAWFQENRALYESEVYEPLCAFITAMSEGCARRGLPLRGSPKASIFRIHRDVRFAKDKRPFKTHAGAVMTRSGAKNENGLFYIHIAPEGCFCAGGFYHLEPAGLSSMRQAILTGAPRYKAMIAALGSAGIGLDPQWSLKRAPREAAGVADEQIVAGLKLKSFVARQAIADERIRSSDLVEDCLGFIEASLPLLDFGWSALADLEPKRG
jgi:uncharacterized protein (TIGR02453 family)